MIFPPEMLEDFRREFREGFARDVDPEKRLSRELMEQLLSTHVELETERLAGAALDTVYASPGFIEACAKKAGNKRIGIIPAGSFAVELASRPGFPKITCFMDNFLHEIRNRIGKIPLDHPGNINLHKVDTVIVATPSITVQDGLKRQVQDLAENLSVFSVGEVALEIIFRQMLARVNRDVPMIAEERRNFLEEGRSIPALMDFSLPVDRQMALLDRAESGEPVFLVTGHHENTDFIIFREIIEGFGNSRVFCCDLQGFVRAGSLLENTLLEETEDKGHPWLNNVCRILWGKTGCFSRGASGFQEYEEISLKKGSEKVKSVNLFIEEIRLLRASFPGKTAVMFVGNAVWHNHLKLMHALKLHGILVILLVGGDRLCGALPLEKFRGFFDLLMVSGQYGTEMPLIVSHGEVDMIHALCHASYDPALSRMLKQKTRPVVVEYTDFLEIMYEEKGYGESGPAMGLSKAREMESLKKDWKTVFTHNDGIIHKESPEVVSYLSKKHGHKPDSLEFHSYINRDFGGDEIPEIPFERKKLPYPSVVYVGSVTSDSGHACSIQDKSLLKTAEVLGKQGIYMAVFNAVDGGSRKGFESYVELARQSPWFDYYPAVPHHLLKRYLSRFDFGIQVLDYSGTQYSRFFLETTFATRVMNYLEAEIPIIMSGRLRHMAELVQKNDVGIVLEYEELKDLGKHIESIDWGKKRKNIQRLKRVYSMEEHLPRLLEFYDRALGERRFYAGEYKMQN